MANNNAPTLKLKITLVRSLIGCSENQRRVATALGLRKTNQTVEHVASPTITRTVQRIKHLLLLKKLPSFPLNGTSA